LKKHSASFFTWLSGLSKRGPVTNRSPVVQERGILRKGESRVKFDQTLSSVRNWNQSLVFQNFEVDFSRQGKCILRKGRYCIKFEQRPSEVGNPNLLLVFQNFELHCLCIRKGCSEKTVKLRARSSFFYQIKEESFWGQSRK
jgi:hypothetical protein